MQLTEDEILKQIVLNENAYFYSNPDEVNLSRALITNLFKTISTGRIGNYLLRVVNKEIVINEQSFNYSICIFRYTAIPSILEEHLENWEEIKLAYILIVDFKDYIMMVRRNVAKLREFLEKFDPIDYKVLSILYVDEDTQIEKLNMQNMNVSDRAMRQKSLESLNLKQNLSPLGASNYVVNNMRVKNDEEKTSLSFNTSRINKLGKKCSIKETIRWGFSQVEKLRAHSDRETFLSIFSESIEFKEHKHNLMPIAILFVFSKLYEDLEQNVIHETRIVLEDGSQRTIDLIKHISRVETLLQVINNDEVGLNTYDILNPYANDLKIKINEKSISISSQKLRNIILFKDNGRMQKLIDYINVSNQFIVNFDNCELIYTNRKLFKDNRLLGNIDNFIKIFRPDPRLENVNSEKGTFTAAASNFSAGSVFNIVEDIFLQDSDYLVCDDLGKEWADHISISGNKIKFIHSKYKEVNFSASAFQDIVGQALKNLGNLMPQDFQLASKQNFWSSNYNNDGIQTQIARLRKGNSIVDFTEKFKSTILEPNHQREVYLVLNFISKSALEIKLQQLRDAEYFIERNEIIQILWFISSFINSCKEAGVDSVYIYCKP
ncbi:hypothetical protein [Flavobacterium granuli]|uniref:Sporadically distributed protein, TIGR04141 family n=1 Tax=Flavobacterium granuli TaxID=280093 RepID=A0ABU1RX48_9FLAO|nr:hypothetical protein [Flavobacterium granuli]MDR6843336.1 hypothetical protein [Flavobacterium granuli]